ncbi:MAG: hypothetical protein IJ323_05330 [Clostridia bacterium]|nr:hypothetical protein [Clostridia bacterium]MBQ7897830.1 hypothetical protein [Clostridia bacterium]
MNENDISAYKKITAPSSIKERLISESAKERKNHHVKAAFCYAAAGIAAMIIFAFTFFWNEGASLYLNGDEIGGKNVFVYENSSVAVARTFTASRVTIPLKTDKDAEITVSSGMIVIDGEDMGQKIKTKKNAEFIWMFEGEADGYQLEVKTDKKSSLYSISHKEGTEKFYIKKVN